MSGKKEDELYITEMQEWLNERKLRIREIENDIELLKNLIGSETKQLELCREIANIGIRGFNNWLTENGFEPTEYV